MNWRNGKVGFVVSDTVELDVGDEVEIEIIGCNVGVGDGYKVGLEVGDAVGTLW